VFKSNKKVLIASDHAGFSLKKEIIKFLESEKYEIIDCGTDSDLAVDYPDYAHKLSAMIKIGKATKGILICGTGNGMAIAANKHQNIRAALCYNEEMASLARKHNDANVLTMGARMISIKKAKEIVKIFLNTKFDGGRHKARIQKI